MFKLLSRKTGLKRVGVFILTAATLYATIISNPFKASAENAKKEVMYLEVSNTLTAHDTFAWDTYDNYNYKDKNF